MRKCRVYNDNTLEHREMFRGSEIVIGPGKFVEMLRDDAVMFKSQFYPPKFNKGGVQERESFKMIRLEEIVEGASKGAKAKKVHRCQACGFEADTAKLLKAHIQENHLDQMIDEDARKELEKD